MLCQNFIGRCRWNLRAQMRFASADWRGWRLILSGPMMPRLLVLRMLAEYLLPMDCSPESPTPAADPAGKELRTIAMACPRRTVNSNAALP